MLLIFSEAVSFAGAFLSLILLLNACATAISRPCTDGGDPALAKPTGGTKQCHQIKGKDGSWQNDGKYREWWPNGKLAIEGDFRDGHKDGIWREWDDKGKKLSEKYFEEGKEVPRVDPPPEKLPEPFASGISK